MDRDQVLFRLFGKYCPEGTILFTEGAPGEELCYVQSGAVRLTRAGAAAAPVRGPGEVLGEEAFFGRAVRECRAEALKDTRLLLVNDRNLEAVVRHGPEVAATVAVGLLERADAGRERLEAWVLARRLRRAEPHLAAATGGPVSVAELAELSGLTPADARSVLDALARRGVLASAGTGYAVPDAGALQETVRALLAEA